LTGEVIKDHAGIRAANAFQAALFGWKAD